MLVIENAGQFDPAARFQVRWGDQTMWVTDDSLWITNLEERSPAKAGPTRGGGFRSRTDTTPRRGVNLRLTFPGRRADAHVVATHPLPTRMNYFLGSDPELWRAGVRTYGAVTWRGLYPGTSLTLTEHRGDLALVLRSTSRDRATVPRLRAAGANAVRVLPEGRLVADTAIGAVPLPVVVHHGHRLAARADGTQLSFTGQPASAPATAAATPTGGPGLRYSTFLGGGDNDFVEDVAVGLDGSAYVTGLTNSADFPATPGAFDTTFGNGDAFVSKINPAGSSLVYGTFLGGNGPGDDEGFSIDVDQLGAAYVGGRTGSEDFPTTPGSYDPVGTPGSDAFVTKLQPDGSSLDYSTYIGGATSGETINALALASNGTVHITGETASTDFPTTPGAYDRTFNGSGDAFVAALNPDGSDLVFSSYLGGSELDYGYGIALGDNGNAYVTGPTQSLNFPTTPGAFDETSNGGNHDVFVTKLTPDGSALAYSTYIGGNESDDAYEVAVDSNGNAYVVGGTGSANYPTTPGAYDTTINSFILDDVFATKLNANGSTLVYSTFLGGRSVDIAHDLWVDSDGSLNLAGNALSTNFPTTPGAFDRTPGGGQDSFVARLSPGGDLLTYSSFLGGNGLDQGLAMAGVAPGVTAIVGATSSTDFPVTPGAYDTTFNGGFFGGGDGFVTTLQVARTMHVDRIVPGYRQSGSGYRVGTAIRVLYADESAVSGASVTVTVSYPDGEEFALTASTGARGIATVSAPATDSGTYTFTVTDVAKAGAVYDPAQNDETSDSVTIP